MRSYTFHVTVNGIEETWRRIELTGEQTLRELHMAIQAALAWVLDDDIAFFLGDDAQGGSEQYVIFDVVDGDEDDEDDWYDDDLADDELDEEIDALVDTLPPLDLGDTPRPETMEQMLDLLESNPDLRSQVSKMLTEQLGIPSFMADMVLSNAKGLFNMLPEGMLADLTGEEPEPKDAAETTLESLGLTPGQTFLYVFGDDDWRFDVHVEAITPEADADATYPRLLAGDGPAPEQYAEWDDDDDWLMDLGEDDEDDDFVEDVQLRKSA